MTLPAEHYGNVRDRIVVAVTCERKLGFGVQLG